MRFKENNKMTSRSLTARRGVIVLFLIVVIGMGVSMARLLYMSVIDKRNYREKAENQQLSVDSTAANRGKIYDSNMNVLAQSASVWKVCVDPSRVTDDSVEKDSGKLVQGNKNLVVNGLSTILGIDAAETKASIESRADKKYLKIKDGVEVNERNKLLEYIEENNLSGVIFMEESTKRYYPNSELASTLIGFIGSDGNGLSGVEYYYDEVLTGTRGRIITAKDAKNNKLPNASTQTVSSVSGNNLVLALDQQIQTILQDALKTAYEETNAGNVYGIVMETKTGAVLAVANIPDFDPNSYKEVLYPSLVEYFKKYGKESEKANPVQAAQNTQWQNKSFSSLYFPGSVYKVFLVAGALEEGVITPETSYNCTGTIQAAGRTVKDYYTTGHGVETPETLLVNSCNCFSVFVGMKMGVDLYYKYFDAFGFTEKTGVDSQGDLNPKAGIAYHDPAISFSTSDLISSSFGQSISVTPLQIITAVSAIGNGGKLMRPYVVQKQTEENGNTVVETQPEVRRQVVSAETAAKVASYMSKVVKNGTGKNAYVPGYRVAGKTGTSEKTDRTDDAYIASFAGFAPYDDPDISVVVIIDDPQGDNYSGGIIAAPVAGEIFEKVLKYRGVTPVYDDDEISAMTGETPNVVGSAIAGVEKTLKDSGYTVRVIGSGSSVVSQMPESGKSIPANGVIALYTDSETPAEKVKVPDFTGLSVSEVRRVAEVNGLNVKISGSSDGSSGVTAYKQDKEKDTEVELGSIITVYCRNTSDVHD